VEIRVVRALRHAQARTLCHPSFPNVLGFQLVLYIPRKRNQRRLLQHPHSSLEFFPILVRSDRGCEYHRSAPRHDVLPSYHACSRRLGRSLYSDHGHLGWWLGLAEELYSRVCGPRHNRFPALGLDAFRIRRPHVPVLLLWIL
jgi:hypothetical protein